MRASISRSILAKVTSRGEHGVGETVRHPLTVLAAVSPDWLRTSAQPERVERQSAFRPRSE
jgi:hypothetical protein